MSSEGAEASSSTTSPTAPAVASDVSAVATGGGGGGGAAWDEIVGRVLSAEGKNAVGITCPVCTCKILQPNMGTFVTEEFYLPFNKKSAGGQNVNRFWQVKDMFDFLNIGFTNQLTSSGTVQRYLTCADCERELIGISFSDPNKILLSCDRVNYTLS
ncbi:guanine nucleotide exchange factor [Pelomyxa schiedti]|nr:guanine nucleotide exchange factor [Pelomyxa schiedti]